MRWKLSRSLVLGTAMTTIVLISAACSSSGSNRSVAAFCGSFKAQAIQLRVKYQMQAASAQGTDPLSGLVSLTGNLLEAQGDLVVLFARLDQVAPSEIEPDVAAVRDGLKQQADAVRNAGTDPLGAFAGGFISALQSRGSVNSVESYLKSNCDLSFMGASTSASAAATQPSTSAAPIAFKTNQGWSYAFTPNVGDIKVQFSKNISSSPPGSARLDITIASSTSGFPGSVASTDQGRTAPGVHLPRSIGLYWPLSDSAKAALFGSGSSYAASWFPDGCLPWHQDSGAVFLCNLNSDGSASKYEGSDAPEAAIDAFLALDVTQGRPFVPVDFYSSDDYAIIPSAVASVLIAPDGTAKLLSAQAPPTSAPPTTISPDYLNTDGWSSNLALGSDDIQWCLPGGGSTFIKSGSNARGSRTDVMTFQTHVEAETWFTDHLKTLSDNGGAISCAAPNNPSWTLSESSLSTFTYKGFNGFSETYDTVALSNRFADWNNESCIQIVRYVVCGSDVSRAEQFIDAVAK
jgi:hypothetical protein